MDRIENLITVGHQLPGIVGEPGRRHWILTAESAGGERWTYTGLVDSLPSATSAEVYTTVLDGISEAYGGRLAVIEWVLRPESLGGGR